MRTNQGVYSCSDQELNAQTFVVEMHVPVSSGDAKCFCASLRGKHDIGFGGQRSAGLCAVARGEEGAPWGLWVSALPGPSPPAYLHPGGFAERSRAVLRVV